MPVLVGAAIAGCPQNPTPVDAGSGHGQTTPTDAPKDVAGISGIDSKAAGGGMTPRAALVMGWPEGDNQMTRKGHTLQQPNYHVRVYATLSCIHTYRPPAIDMMPDSLSAYWAVAPNSPPPPQTASGLGLPQHNYCSILYAGTNIGTCEQRKSNGLWYSAANQAASPST